MTIFGTPALQAWETGTVVLLGPPLGFWEDGMRGDMDGFGEGKTTNHVISYLYSDTVPLIWVQAGIPRGSFLLLGICCHRSTPWKPHHSLSLCPSETGLPPMASARPALFHTPAYVVPLTAMSCHSLKSYLLPEAPFTHHLLPKASSDFTQINTMSFSWEPQRQG